jgi:hypothetical protein
MRAVRAWTLGDGTGLLQLRAADTDIVFADQLVTDLANAEPDTAPDGTPLDMDQRRSDGLMRLFRRVREGGDLPRVHVRREREIGLVLHADTLFADGPAADAPGELRGLGSPAALDPATASEIARAEIARGTATQVLLTDGQGRLQRVVRLTHAPEDGWTRATLTEAVRTKLRDLPPLNTDGYQPTTAITEHVHARNPRCTAYDCPRSSRRSDLDHDEPWPRGPTDVSNLHPRCRRHHRLKTARLVQTRLGEHGAVTTTMLTGVRVPTAPEPLPGHAPGEGYAAGWKLAA